MVPKIRKINRTFICKKCFGKIIVKNIPIIDYKSIGISHDLYFNGLIKSCPHCGATYNKLTIDEKGQHSAGAVAFEVDGKIADDVQILLAVGCRTTYSCQGHLRHKYGLKEPSLSIPYIALKVDERSKWICLALNGFIQKHSIDSLYIEEKIRDDWNWSSLNIHAKSYLYDYIHTESKFAEINDGVLNDIHKIMNDLVTGCFNANFDDVDINKLNNVINTKPIIIDIDKM